MHCLVGRYFIVIDDVWDIKSRERIMLALVGNSIGSRIIITTRNLEVAAGGVYKLQPLSEDDSKKLFYARNFGGEDNKCPDHQQHKVSEAACKILRKCGGIPLAIITMASLLVGKPMEEWLEVCNSTGFCDKDKGQLDDTTWILSLSYYDLPSHLKTCLLYLSVFPEDHTIQKDALIWMWVAEGFVHKKPGIGLYDVGEGYFNSLVNRSLIQPVEDKESRIIYGCHVHDMILDLIRSLSREAKFAMVLDNSEEDATSSGSNNARRLALHKTGEDTLQNNLTDTARVRSLIALIRCGFGPGVQLRSFKLLRVLYLEGCPRVPFSEHVGDLLHLRYLGIRNSLYGLVLPKGGGAFKFLRVLDLEDIGISSTGTLSLPPSVSTLAQLVCLRAKHHRVPGGTSRTSRPCRSWTSMPGTTASPWASL
jgi:disease resistance protein RPM1